MRNCVIDSYAGPLNNFTGKTDYENDIFNYFVARIFYLNLLDEQRIARLIKRYALN